MKHSVESRCAKTGPEWSLSFAYHYNWCMQEPDDDVVRRALSTRNFEAMHCEEGAQRGATSDTMFPPVVTDEQPGAAATNFPPVVDDATAGAPSGALPPVVEDKAAPDPTPDFPPVAATKGSTDTDKKSDATEAVESSQLRETQTPRYRRSQRQAPAWRSSLAGKGAARRKTHRRPSAAEPR